jgi:colanic acid biosynthesis glycosyl transferase WcaI
LGRVGFIIKIKIALIEKLNIVLVSQYFPPDPGGSSTRTYNLARGLALNGCNVTVIAGFPHYPYGNIPKKYRCKPIAVEYVGKIKVIRTLMPPVKSKGFIRRLALLTHFSVSALFALPFVGKVDAVWAASWVPGYIISRAKRATLAFNVDDLTLEDIVDLKVLPKESPIIKIAERVFRIFFTKADIITPISPGYFETITKKYCVKPEKIKLVRGGVDLSVFKQSKPNLAPNHKFTVLYSGGFSVAYDFQQIFDAGKILEKRDADVEFIIQGSGELLSEMLSSVRKMKVKNVRIINKILSRAEVSALLNQADALILPLYPFYKKTGRRYAGISSKLYEYQAAGKPIISCCNGVPSDYIKSTNSGIAINSGSYEALADAVLTLKSNPELARAMGMNGRRFVERKASIEIIGLKMNELLNEIITQ